MPQIQDLNLPRTLHRSQEFTNYNSSRFCLVFPFRRLSRALSALPSPASPAACSFSSTENNSSPASRSPSVLSEQHSPAMLPSLSTPSWILSVPLSLASMRSETAVAQPGSALRSRLHFPMAIFSYAAILILLIVSYLILLTSFRLSTAATLVLTPAYVLLSAAVGACMTSVFHAVRAGLGKKQRRSPERMIMEDAAVGRPFGRCECWGGSGRRGCGRVHWGTEG